MATNNDDRVTDIRVDFLLDAATREAGLWDSARGRGWWTDEDASQLLTVVGFTAMAIGSVTRDSIEPGLLFPVFAIAAAASWRSHRLSRRLDAILTLIERAAAKR